MKRCIYLLALLLIFFGSAAEIVQAQRKHRAKRPAVKKMTDQTKYGCLPPDVKLDTIVSTQQVETPAGNKIERETVKQRLDKINAGCKSGKLVDAKGREIRFYKLQDCWGNPPQDYLEIIAHQRRELDELKKKYTVIELTCNPGGGMPF